MFATNVGIFRRSKNSENCVVQLQMSGVSKMYPLRHIYRQCALHLQPRHTASCFEKLMSTHRLCWLGKPGCVHWFWKQIFVNSPKNPFAYRFYNISAKIRHSRRRHTNWYSWSLLPHKRTISHAFNINVRNRTTYFCAATLKKKFMSLY